MPYDITPTWSQWREALRTDVRVVAALVRREMRAHFGESRLGYLWALIEPGLHLLAYWLLFAFVMHRLPALGTSIPLFMLTGVVPYFLYSKIATYISQSIGSNRQLLTLPPVKPQDVIAARTVVESATYMFVGGIFFFVLFLNGTYEALPYDPLPVMEACAFAVTIGLGIGMINLVIGCYFHNWMTFFGFLSTPLWFFSGIFYVPEQIPEPFRDYLMYNPLVHIILLFRMGFYRELRPELLDIPYLVAFTGVVLAFGLALMRVAQRRVLAPI